MRRLHRDTGAHRGRVMCRLCRESQRDGAKAAAEDIARRAGELVQMSEAGHPVEPEQFFAAYMNETLRYYEAMVRQFRKDGRPKCPMEMNQA